MYIDEKQTTVGHTGSNARGECAVAAQRTENLPVLVVGSVKNRCIGISLSGKSDEENFGFSYAVLDWHIRTNPSERVDGTLDGEKIERKHSETAHKRALPLKIAGKPLD